MPGEWFSIVHVMLHNSSLKRTNLFDHRVAPGGLGAKAQIAKGGVTAARLLEGPAYYTSGMKLEPRDEGSYLSMTFTRAPTGTMAKVMAATVGHGMADSARKGLEQDPDNIVPAAEQVPS
jgi:hypothetical protein